MILMQSQSETKVALETRSTICQAIRQRLALIGCIEVTTPILSPYPDVAPIPQFSAKHPITKVEGYLRIAPTESLKRLMVRGLDSVYEFSRNFRPDEEDSSHLIEFTSLEVMTVGRTYRDMASLTEELCKSGLAITSLLLGSYQFSPSNETKIATCKSLLETPWSFVDLPSHLKEHYGFSDDNFFDDKSVRSLHFSLTGKNAPHIEMQAAMDDIVTAVANSFPHPVFVGRFPWYLGGPAKPCENNLNFKERAELFFGGLELANMSSNLTDPEMLIKWYEEGVIAKKALGITSNKLDSHLLKELAIGLSPSSVLGIGIDRLVMVCLGLSSIQSTNSFTYSTMFSNID